MACGGHQVDVHLDNGAGLGVGSPVQVNGLRVGEVSSVGVDPAGGVAVQAKLDQELVLHNDACAIGGGSPPTLYLSAGTGTQPLVGPVPACEVGEQLRAAMGEAAAALGDLVQGLGSAFGGSSAMTGTPSNPAGDSNQVREAGRALGEATRNFGEGFLEGAVGQPGQPQQPGTTPPPPQNPNTMPPPPGFGP